MSKAKLARLEECSQVVSLASIRSFNIANTYSMVKIKKWNFLMGQKIYLIWSFLVGQREYVGVPLHPPTLQSSLINTK